MNHQPSFGGITRENTDAEFEKVVDIAIP